MTYCFCGVALPSPFSLAPMAGVTDRACRTIALERGAGLAFTEMVSQKLTDIDYEAKFIYYSKTFDDKVRTFCMNPFGEVVTETIDEIVTVNGHSYANKKTENTNFAILVSNTFTEPFHDPIGYGKVIARLANFLGNGVIIQRLGDLLDGRRSTPDRINRCITQPTLPSATPGDLSFVLPYRHLKSIIEMLEALDRITPGIFSRHTLLYGVEVKFYTNLSSSRADQPGNCAQGGGLASPVRADQSDKLTLLHLQRHIPQDGQVVITGLEVDDF